MTRLFVHLCQALSADSLDLGGWLQYDARPGIGRWSRPARSALAGNTLLPAGQSRHAHP
ncbi:MAG TPA: hypothetical protein PKC78_10995 [Accumulibacter sp.]|nr:hypothetical protein [Accumulibacter sp.]